MASYGGYFGRYWRCLASACVIAVICMIGQVGFSPVVANARTAIVCDAQLQYPHRSTHAKQAGTIAVAISFSVSCTEPVYSVEAKITISYNGSYVTTFQQTSHGSNPYNFTAFVDCRDGVWMASAQYTVTFPSGSNPPIETKFGGDVKNAVTCGG